MVWLLTLVLVGPPPAAPPAPDNPRAVASRALTAEALLASETRRLRSGSARLTTMIGDGVRRSRTFADLVRALHDTNVIVYVEPVHVLPVEVAGRILLQTVAGGQRYLRVQVRPTLPRDQIIAVIAHELQHALEVAGDPNVVDEAGLKALYWKIGHMTYGMNGFDTDAARETGRVVWQELAG